MTEPLTILIVDDHPLFRKGLQALLATVPQVHVVGTAATGSEAVQVVAHLLPRLVLMDLHMPDGDGLTAISTMTAASYTPFILVVTMFEDDDAVFGSHARWSARLCAQGHG